ncbi:flagellum-associated coiled-coil domain-containing protein 1 isoform X2 [Xenopus tropicalis]|uniref:Flagellum-associated coiled-coil domain-containing protein 1 isoform X2 n=1 Tax=Xenopus tropicalis TaxID=8364 RepID=A0A8J0SY87_XENTR|nr:flagellum-associated coiled-coil domain-containing protein 1 isoform X2 [Xenopus tropicalis]
MKMASDSHAGLQLKYSLTQLPHSLKQNRGITGSPHQASTRSSSKDPGNSWKPPVLRNEFQLMEKPCGNTKRPRTSPSVYKDQGRDLLFAKPPSSTKKCISARTTGSRAPNKENNKRDKEYLLISPGYTMIRSKDHIEVMLEESLFRDTAGSKSPPASRQGIVEDLQEQIAKLTSLLEQETKEHRNTEIRLNKEIQEVAAQLQKKNEEDIRILQQKHLNDLQALLEQSNSKLAQENADAEKRLEELQKDYDFLRGSFSTYKESLCEEINESWAQKEAQWKEAFEEKKVRALSKQNQELRDLFEKEKKELWRQAEEELDMVQESHKKQVNEVWEKYKEVKQEFQKLNIMKENLQAEIAENKRIISSQHLEAQKVHRENEMLKSQVDHLRKQTHVRVSKVEAQFKQRIVSLTNENADLRRRLITKSEQLFNERNKDEVGATYLDAAGNGRL